MDFGINIRLFGHKGVVEDERSTRYRVADEFIAGVLIQYDLKIRFRGFWIINFTPGNDDFRLGFAASGFRTIRLCLYGVQVPVNDCGLSGNNSSENNPLPA